MAMPVDVMDVEEFIQWAWSNGCELVIDPRITWRVNGVVGRNPSPRYRVNGGKRLALPANDKQPLDVYAVWAYKYRLGLEADPTWRCGLSRRHTTRQVSRALGLTRAP